MLLKVQDMVINLNYVTDVFKRGDQYTIRLAHGGDYDIPESALPMETFIIRWMEAINKRRIE